MRALLLTLFLLPFTVFSQDLIGIWTGTLSTSQQKLPYEIAFFEDSGKIVAYSYISFSIKNSEEVALKKLTISEDDGKIITEDKDLVYDTYKTDAPKKIKQVDELSFKEDGKMLKGNFSVKRVMDLKPIGGQISLQKTDNPDTSKLYAKLLELNLANSLSFKTQKKLDDKVEIADIPKPDTTTQTIVQKTMPEIKPITLPPVEKKDTTEIVVAPPKEEPIPQPVTEITKPIDTTTKPIDKTIAINKPTPSPVTKPVDTVAKVDKSVAANKPTIPPVQKPVATTPKPIVVTKPQAPPPVAVQKPAPVTPKPVAPKPQPAIAKPTLPVTPPPVVAKPPAPKPQPIFVPVGSAKDIAKRTIENISTLYFTSDSVTITLYDNGYVDGDTVSVLLNGNVIMGKEGLSTKPVTKTIYTTDVGDSMQIVMYAENLGTIPPNTGVLILLDGKKRYEVRFSGDLTKNAAITLRRRKEGE